MPLSQLRKNKLSWKKAISVSLNFRPMNHYVGYATEQSQLGIGIDRWLEMGKMLYLESSCMSNICFSTTKYLLRNDVHSKINIQKKQIPLSMFHSRFPCEGHRNPKPRFQETAELWNECDIIVL